MKIIRKDGIEYERKNREIKVDTSVTFRVSSKDFEVFKEYCFLENTTPSKEIRTFIEKRVKEHLESRTVIDTHE